MVLGLRHKLGIHSPDRTASPGPANTDDQDEMDAGGQLILMGIIAQLRPGMDLSRITLPTFILELKLMLERITNQLQQPDLLLQAASATDPVERFVAVVRWYMLCWHIAPKAVKKPLNPVLGEYFTCYWDLADGARAYYVAEQVLHHPPELAYFYCVPQHRIRVDGLVVPKLRFLGNLTAAMMDGKTVLTLGNEVYLLTQPNIYARGILVGKLKFELGDHMVIRCEQTGLEADIEFKVKGFISGTYDAIEGTVSKDGQVLYDLSGKWNDVMYITEHGSSSREVLFDTTKATPVPPTVRPLAAQGAFELRKLWHPTVEALHRRDHEEATAEKFKVEDQQRSDTKSRAESGVSWVPRLFKPAPPGDELDFRILHLLDLAHGDPAEVARAVEAMAPFYEGLHSELEVERSHR